MERIYLKIVDFNYGEINIPFLSLRELDLFTVRYQNPTELLEALSQILELPIVPESVAAILVSSLKNNGNRIESKNYLVKCARDNYDVQHFQEAFRKYLLENPSRILSTPMSRIRTAGVIGYVNGEHSLTEFDISLAVSIYFENASYHKIRDLYFRFRNKMNVKINKVDPSKSRQVDKNVSKFTSEDPYISYLLQRASKGELEYEESIEELSLMDLEELNRNVDAPHYGIFDGMDTENDKYIGDIGDLEKYSGFKLEELIKMLSVSGKKKSRR